MNRIDELFNKKAGNILSVYFTAGYPALDSTVEIIRELASEGTDMIEIGVPFSDPVADGPVIQKSNDTALKKGMSLRLLFDQLKDIRKETDIPLLLMSYINPVLRFGIEKFCKKCEETGIDGVILPDLTPEIYTASYLGLFKEHNIYNVLLISKGTSAARIREIDGLSRIFIYMVSSSSTTGIKRNFSADQKEYFLKVKKMNLRNPALIGFGISDNETYLQACKYGAGAIIGSAFIKALSEGEGGKNTVRDFIKKIR
ncbi:MAG TPA: tryptophan synthase subunit alpha [Bacteroidales bacterium]|nr:MAG: Tryptophan synthase alpha chain [Bacteroidetes bacterium ADurb.Bin145]HOU02282.1 tryptophan synthase subunit alpha [Bacteroidales bacterium]HQK68287.1 tryptophan synthase subunit alpha [Bacteroidales bacterium]